MLFLIADLMPHAGSLLFCRGVIRTVISVIFLQDLIDLVGGRCCVSNTGVMVKIIYDRCQILAHICNGEPGPCHKLRSEICKISTYDFVYPALFIGFIKTIDSVGEKTERASYKNPFCIAILELAGGVKHRTT